MIEEVWLGVFAERALFVLLGLFQENGIYSKKYFLVILSNL